MFRCDSIARKTHTIRIDAWYRLPSNSVPESYNITLTTRIHEGRKEFSGTVEIGLRTILDSTNITIHQRRLTITKVELWRRNNATILEPIKNLTFDSVTEKYTILTNHVLPLNTSYTLKIAYNGTLRQDEAGFYESWYVNENRQIR